MKIAIIGVGSVGSAVATAVQNTGLAHEIVLFDRDGVRARAAAEDLGHAGAFSYDIKITSTKDTSVSCKGTIQANGGIEWEDIKVATK
jgi:malate/lactate dehydrogenase